MAIDHFIPSVWSTQLLTSLKKSLVFAQPAITNRDYQGEISRAGDTVKINSISKVTVSSYTKNGTIASPEELTGAQTNLVVDQSDYFHFFVDDVDQAQQNVTVMTQAMVEAGYALANKTDQFLEALLKDVFDGSTALANQIGTTASPKAISAATDAYNYLVDLSVRLNMANVPMQGRWAVVPPWFIGNLRKDDRFVNSLSNPSAGDALLNGFVARAAGFALLESNNSSHESTGDVNNYYFIYAGTNMAMTAVDQITAMEAYRPELKFADAVKGLHVYGAKVVRPEAVACLIVDRNA